MWLLDFTIVQELIDFQQSKPRNGMTFKDFEETDDVGGIAGAKDIKQRLTYLNKTGFIRKRENKYFITPKGKRFHEIWKKQYS